MGGPKGPPSISASVNVRNLLRSHDMRSWTQPVVVRRHGGVQLLVLGDRPSRKAAVISMLHLVDRSRQGSLNLALGRVPFETCQPSLPNASLPAVPSSAQLPLPPQPLWLFPAAAQALLRCSPLPPLQLYSHLVRYLFSFSTVSTSQDVTSSQLRNYYGLCTLG